MAIFRQGISNSNPSNFKRSSENFSPLQENLRELNSQIKAFRVTDIVLDENHPEFKTVGEYNGIGAIFYEEVNSPLTDSESKNSFALPYDSQLKTYPLINEIVLVFFLPSQRIGEVSSAKQYFYLKPLNLWNHPHHDAYPNLSIENQNLNQSQDYISTTNGSIRRVEDGSTEINLNSPKNESQNTFVEKVDIKPLMPFMGDSLMEGRYGQSIRFGSTAKSKSLINNNWSESGENGDPITIIRNGQPEKLSDDRGWIPITENINKDLSSIYLTSKQKIKEVLICGGGRKNKILLKKIKENLQNTINLKLIDNYDINGDFVESQAFAFLAVRSIMKLPISFPSTNGCKHPSMCGKYT